MNKPKGRHHQTSVADEASKATARKSLRVPIALASAAIVAVGIGFALFSSVTTTRADAAPLGNADHGKLLYAQFCVTCHGASGQGEFNWMNRERAAPPLDSSGHAWHHEDAQLVDMILNKPAPDSRMPAWSSVLSRNDAYDLLSFIKTMWTPYIRDNCQGAKHMACMRMR